MKTLIYGAGPIGRWLALRMHQAGQHHRCTGAPALAFGRYSVSYSAKRAGGKACEVVRLQFHRMPGQIKSQGVAFRL